MQSIFNIKYIDECTFRQTSLRTSVRGIGCHRHVRASKVDTCRPVRRRHGVDDGGLRRGGVGLREACGRVVGVRCGVVAVLGILHNTCRYRLAYTAVPRRLRYPSSSETHLMSYDALLCSYLASEPDPSRRRQDVHAAGTKCDI